jgi:three-Cys-motif partner protein
MVGRDNGVRAELRSEIGPWSELKLDIIREYAKAYSDIFNARAQQRFHHVYIDAFAGAGRHISRLTGELVPGSPMNALATDPPFRHYYFIDIDALRVARLEEIARNRSDVTVYHGDANEMLAQHVLPKVRYEDYRRGLCLLDPYGMHYEWQVVETIGQMRTIDLFLNFPIMDMNMNPLRRASVTVDPSQVERMTRFWGDDSWYQEFYSPQVQLGLFGDSTSAKTSGNEQVVAAYIQRLHAVAGFQYIPKPIPMRNGIGRTVYYLIFAAHKQDAGKIVEQIFDKYRSLGA